MTAAVCDETASLGRQLYRDQLRAVVLTGSLARNEGTFVDDENGARLHGDAEFLFVFHDASVLPRATDVSVLRQQIEQRLQRRNLRAEITVSAVRPSYLRRLTPSIFAYELRTCGQAVAGDRNVLALIPAFDVADIPRQDAWRMLANRLVEQLESVDELLVGRPTLSPGSYYRTVKLYLDMATSFLVFAGGYAPTYGERAKALGLLAGPPEAIGGWPFAVDEFARDVAACTAWKLSPTRRPIDEGRGFWERAVDYAQSLWRWELALLLGRDAASTSQWMRRQPVSDRLRGWAHVVRQDGWLSSWPRWSQWSRLALSTSPRYAVYAAATELLFALRSANAMDAARRAVELSRQLPLARRNGSQSAKSACSELARDVLLNYRKFLVNTCS